MCGKLRIAIDVRAEGLPDDQQRALYAEGFEFLADLERDERATWAGEERPTPGRRYIFLVDARDAAQAKTRARRIVGPETKIRVTPHGGRVTE